MIDNGKSLLFVHIPKCAGTFIEKNLTPKIDWHEKGEKHFSLQRCIDVYGELRVRDCFRFAVIRNPFSRLLSFYLYHQRKRTDLFSINPIEKYARAFRREYYRKFSDFVFNLMHYSHKLKTWAKNDILPCHQFLISHQGIGVELLLRQENLSSDLEILTKRTGLAFVNKHINASPSHYKLTDYYGETEINFVLDFYRADFFHYYPGHQCSDPTT